MKKPNISPIPVDELMEKIRCEVDAKRFEENNIANRFYTWGEPLDFGETGTSQPFLLDGWDKPDQRFRWTLGKKSTLSLAVPKSDANLLLSILAHPLNGNLVQSQSVSVKWNDKLIGEWEVTKKRFYFAYIFNRNLDCTLNTIEIGVSTATSPQNCGINDDLRILGIGVHALKIVPIHTTRATQ